MENREEYPSNAHKYRNIGKSGETLRQDKKEDLKPIAKGKEPKRTFKQWLTDNFLQASAEEVKKAVIEDWVKPGAKNLIEFVVHMLLHNGEKIDPRYRSGTRSDLRESGGRYLRAYEDRRREAPSQESAKRSKQPEIVFVSKQDAEDVRMGMLREMEDGKRASLKDLYLLSDMPTDSMMINWGWSGLTENDIEVSMLPTGEWVLRMPKAVPLTK